MKLEEVIVAMKFGRFGREDNTLVMISKDGSLIVKILKRMAKFTVQSTSDERSIGNAMRLMVPKKTKLFVDQTMREREQYLNIHKTFEHELVRLKLNAARTYVKSLQSSLNPVSLNNSESIKLSAKVCIANSPINSSTNLFPFPVVRAGLWSGSGVSNPAGAEQHER